MAVTDAYTRFKQSLPAAGLPVRNAGGIAEPQAATPRGPVIPDKPVARTRQDSIERPILAPSTTRPIPQPPGAQPVTGQPAPPGAPAGLSAKTPLPPPPPGTAAPPGAVGPGGQPVAPPPGQVQQLGSDSRPIAPGAELKPEAAPAPVPGQPSPVADTSGLMSGMRQQQDAELIRKSQPSPIAGHVQGTYEQVVRDPEIRTPSGGISQLSDKQKTAWKADAHAQLEKFGDYPGKGDPSAPAPPIRPHGRSFNPFSGSFTGKGGFTIAGVNLQKYKNEYFKNGGR